MRYIYSTAILILVMAGLAGITLLKQKPPSSREAVRVNEHVITDEEYRKAYEERASTCPIPPDKAQFLDDFVTKDILIQEARRLGLDREEPFRRSIQNYYEQTLLKNLTQKMMSDIVVSVSEQEIVSSYESMGKVYELRVLTLPTEGEARDAIRTFPLEKAEKKVLRADEIPAGMLDAILALRVGEVSLRPVACEGGFLVFRMEGYMKEPVPPIGEVREQIRKTIEAKKKQGRMEEWLEGLKKNSRVTVNESLVK